MGRIPIIFDEDVEVELRNRAKVKGDLSRMVNDACRLMFNQMNILLDRDVHEELKRRSTKYSKDMDMGREINDALRTVFLMKAPKKK